MNKDCPPPVDIVQQWEQQKNSGPEGFRKKINDALTAVERTGVARSRKDFVSKEIVKAPKRKNKNRKEVPKTPKRKLRLCEVGQFYRNLSD